MGAHVAFMQDENLCNFAGGLCLVSKTKVANPFRVICYCRNSIFTVQSKLLLALLINAIASYPELLQHDYPNKETPTILALKMRRLFLHTFPNRATSTNDKTKIAHFPILSLHELNNWISIYVLNAVQYGQKHGGISGSRHRPQ